MAIVSSESMLSGFSPAVQFGNISYNLNSRNFVHNDLVIVNLVFCFVRLLHVFVSAAVLYAVTNFTNNGKFVLMNWCYPFCVAIHNSGF